MFELYLERHILEVLSLSWNWKPLGIVVPQFGILNCNGMTLSTLGSATLLIIQFEPNWDDSFYHIFKSSVLKTGYFVQLFSLLFIARFDPKIIEIFIKYKIVLFWISFPTPQSLFSYDFGIIYYFYFLLQLGQFKHEQS